MVKLTIVAVSGVGGTGKTAAARGAVKKLNEKAKKGEKYELVELNILASQLKAFKSYDATRKSNIVNMEKLEAELNKLKKQHKNMIFEGLFAHEYSADIVIVLRCDPTELERRLKRKYRWHTKITENVEAEMMGIITTEALAKHKSKSKTKSKVFEIDTSKKKTEQTADIIIEIIKNRPDKYKAGSINWLNRSWVVRRVMRRPKFSIRDRFRGRFRRDPKR